jgi:hypothetical protein
MKIEKSFPLVGAKLGQAWIYQTDQGIFAQYAYQDLTINLSEFSDQQALRLHLLERGIPYNVTQECLSSFSSYRLASPTISDRIPNGVDTEKLGLHDSTAFKPLIQGTVVKLLKNINEALDAKQGIDQPLVVIEILKTLLHFDTVKEQLDQIKIVETDQGVNIEQNVTID